MARATGIGGVFFRARDPVALAAWYRDQLGLPCGHDALWMQEAGPTVFAPFARDSEYFAADRQMMLNLRVDDLAALLASLSAAGIAVETREEWDAGGYGRFARIQDPEGNPVELWEPPAE